MTMESGEKWSNDFPSLSRDTGAEILSLIANAKGLVPLALDLEFVNDALWCEGAYVIDLDADTFTSYWSRHWREDDDKQGEWVFEVTLTFEEIRQMSEDDYLAKFESVEIDA